MTIFSYFLLLAKGESGNFRKISLHLAGFTEFFLILGTQEILGSEICFFILNLWEHKLQEIDDVHFKQFFMQDSQTELFKKKPALQKTQFSLFFGWKKQLGEVLNF